MSQKINAKNLQYNLNLPPFLARLRGQGASGADHDGPDPILAARRRPVKPRSASADAEDAPLVVDEHGNSLEVTVEADGTVTEKEEPTPAGSEDKAQQEGAPADTDAAAASGEKVAGIGGQRKRKIGKVVGVGADEEDAEDKSNHDRASRGKAKTGNTTSVQGTKDKDDSAAAAKSKTRKKAKKIKLSFGDDEG
jgi:hypothetical protein